ncbi:hypothetical protein [Oceanicaulis sp.]|jgi:hypothetical protein|uniref:hypothetical protein n=1 Tax=Oceanicaulis sp. TaxID=1924941 RepID=UPI003F6E84D7
MLNMKMMLAGALVAAAATVGFSSQAGSSEPMYFYYFYSDASMTDVVGFRRDVCTNGYVTSAPLLGQRTPYVETELVGMCPGYLF